MEEHDTQRHLSETVTSSALPAPALEGEDELLTCPDPAQTPGLCQPWKPRAVLGLTAASVRPSWFTAKPAGQDAGAEVKIRGVFPWDDSKVALRWEHCRQVEWSGLHSGF